jgi:hypothetical protein
MRKCPTEQQLAEYADQQSIGADRHGIELHLVGCDRCLRQVGFLVRNARTQLPNVPEELLQRAKRLGGHKPHGLPFPWGWATAATGALAGLLIIFMTGSRPGQQVAPSEVRGHSEVLSQPANPATPPPAVESSAIRGTNPGTSRQLLLFPQAGQTVAAVDLTFRWSGAANAQFYDLQVLSDDGDVVWETQTKASWAKLPGRVHLSEGRTYYVRLRIHGSQNTIEESKTVPFVAQ